MSESHGKLANDNVTGAVKSPYKLLSAIESLRVPLNHKLHWKDKRMVDLKRIHCMQFCFLLGCRFISIENEKYNSNVIMCFINFN